MSFRKFLLNLLGGVTQEDYDYLEQQQFQAAYTLQEFEVLRRKLMHYDSFQFNSGGGIIAKNSKGSMAFIWPEQLVQMVRVK